MNVNVSFLAAFVSGVLTFISPCILPLIPAYVSFITGISLETVASGQRTKFVVFLNGLAFVAGFSLVFITLGASATVLGNMLMVNVKWVRIIGGLAIITFGLILIGVFKIKLLQKEFRYHFKAKPIAGYFGSMLIGATFAAGWTPCVGPILGSILILAGTQNSLSDGIQLLGVYSAGLAMPFLAATLAIDRFAVMIKKYGKFTRGAEIVSGLILIAVGILVVTGKLALISELAVGKYTSWSEWLLKKGL